MEIEYSLNEIGEVASKILKEAEHVKCFAFFAEMGAGKTTLINAICAALNVEDSISSPTYSIINEYRTADDKLVVHMDWYRLADEIEVLNAGAEDYMYTAAYSFIEWPERAQNLLPEGFARVELEAIDANTRRIKLVI